MAIKYLLDTNICIYLLNSRYEHLTNKIAQSQMGELGMSVITQGELHHGIAKSKHKKQTLGLFNQITEYIAIMPFSDTVGQHYAEIRYNLETKGEVIGNNDLWIAAHALDLDVVLVTNNTREFSRVKKLKIENWIL